jgi:predicted MFS family arabinose efflux permease
MLLVSGVANAFPVFLPPLLEEFGASRAATASAVSLLWLGGAALGPLAGWLVTRGDPRLLVAGGLASATAGLLVGALARTLRVFSLAVGVGGGIGVGLTGMVTQAALLADAFVRRRGVAMGIAFSGSMAAYVLALPLQAVITRLGWRAALVAYAGATLALAPTAWRILPARLRPRVRGGATAAREPGVAAIVRSLPFWTLAVLFTTPPLLGYLATTQHALYLGAHGFTAAQASALLGVGGVLAASGRVLFGILADRIGAPSAGFVSLSTTAVGLLALLAMELRPHPLLVYVYVLFVFLPMGSRATIVSVLVSRIAPPAHYGVIFGLIGIGNSLGAAVGPVLSGAIYDWTGSYLALYLSATAVLGVGLGTLALYCLLTRS